MLCSSAAGATCARVYLEVLQSHRGCVTVRQSLGSKMTSTPGPYLPRLLLVDNFSTGSLRIAAHSPSMLEKAARIRTRSRGRSIVPAQRSMDTLDWFASLGPSNSYALTLNGFLLALEAVRLQRHKMRKAERGSGIGRNVYGVQLVAGG